MEMRGVLDVVVKRSLLIRMVQRNVNYVSIDGKIGQKLASVRYYFSIRSILLLIWDNLLYTIKSLIH